MIIHGQTALVVLNRPIYNPTSNASIRSYAGGPMANEVILFSSTFKDNQRIAFENSQAEYDDIP
jgi:CDP-glycerol glycerophosphotransferase (TagB/SpsB family)